MDTCLNGAYHQVVNKSPKMLLGTIMCSDWLKCLVTINIVIVLYHSVSHLIKLMTSLTLWRVRCVAISCDILLW